MLRLLVSQLLITGDWSPCDCIGATDGFERVVEDPFRGMFDRFVENVRKEGNSRETKLDHQGQFQTA